MNKKIILIGGTIILIVGIGIFVMNKEEKVKPQEQEVLKNIEIETYEEVDEWNSYGEKQIQINNMYKNIDKKNTYRNQIEIRAFNNEEIVENKNITSKISKEFGYTKRYIQDIKENANISVMIDEEGRKFYYREDLKKIINEEEFKKINTLREWIEIKDENLLGREIANKITYEKRSLFVESIKESDIENLEVSEYDENILKKYRILIENQEKQNEIKEMIEEIGVRINGNIISADIEVLIDNNGNLNKEQILLEVQENGEVLLWEMNIKYSDWSKEMDFEENMNQDNIAKKEEY